MKQNKNFSRAVNFDNSFPFSHQPSRFSTSNSTFNSTRDKFLNHLDEFDSDHSTSNEMFIDRSPFASSFVSPSSMMARHPGYMSQYRNNMNEPTPSEHPRVINIPIQVETPEGLVPLRRSNSNDCSSPYARRNLAHMHQDQGIPFSSSSSRPTERSRYFHERPERNDISPDGTGFNHHQTKLSDYDQQPETYFNVYQPRVHSIPVQIERISNPQRPGQDSKSIPKSIDDVSHSSVNYDSSCDGKRSRSFSESKTRQPEVCRAVNIPINIMRNDTAEPQIDADGNHNASTAESNQRKEMDNKKDSSDPISFIKEVEQEVHRLEKEIIDFNGEYLDKQYRYLDEMLLRCMLKLDSIDSNGRDDIRTARKTTLKYVDRCLAILEGKVNKPKLEEFEENSGVLDQCDEQPEIVTIEPELVEHDNNDSSFDEFIRDTSPDAKNDQLDTDKDSDQTNGNLSMEISNESEPSQVLETSHLNESITPDMSNDQSDFETCSADSTRVNLDDTPQYSQADLTTNCSQDMDSTELQDLTEPRIESPPEDVSVEISVKSSTDSEAFENDSEQSLTSAVVDLVSTNGSDDTKPEVLPTDDIEISDSTSVNTSTTQESFIEN